MGVCITNIEKTCTDAIAVVQSYLDGHVAASDMSDELDEALELVNSTGGYLCECEAEGNLLLGLMVDKCSAAWTACLAAKNGQRYVAKMYVAEYKELVK